MRTTLIAVGAAALMAWCAPAWATPSTQSTTTAKAASVTTQLAQRDRDRDRDRDRMRDRSRDRSRDRMRDRDRNRQHNPNAWRQHYPDAIMGRPHWSRGDRLYRSYRGPQYYVHDWRRYHLRRPPHGYRWVRVNDDFLLVAITTGIIMDVILQSQMQHR